MPRVTKTCAKPKDGANKEDAAPTRHGGRDGRRSGRSRAELDDETQTRRVVTVAGTKRGRIRKKLFRRRAQSTPSRACACLHGLFHGQPGTQPSSPMPPASPTIARARRAPNPLHLLLTVIGRHGVHCFWQPRRAPWSCPQHSIMLGARSSMWSVRPACQLLQGKPVACWVRAKKVSVVGSVSRQGQILDFE